MKVTVEPNKVVLVTGGARRIGRAICIELHQRGYKVIIHCHNSVAEAARLASELNRSRAHSAAVLQADLTDSKAIDKLAVDVEHVYGRLDVLINNASTFYPTAVSELNETQWHDLMATNLKAPFFLAKALLPQLHQSNGCIINLVDINSERPRRGFSVYSIAKAGNRMMVMALAQEFAPSVRVNGIAPGAMLWPENAEGEQVEAPEKLHAIPLQCLGGTEPIARAVHYLIEHAPYTTGQILTIDGGQSLGF